MAAGKDWVHHDRVCLLPRLAISDLIMINGLVRTLCASTDVMLLVKRPHASTIRSLYGDITSLRFKFLDSWSELHSSKNSPTGGGVLDDIRRMGYHVVPLPSYRQTCPYALLDMDPALAHTAFSMRRNMEAEAALLAKVQAVVGRTYVVVHDDARVIRRTSIPTGYPVVHVRDPRFRTANMFDWVTVIDQAVQFHGVDSCFMLMADFLGLRARKYLHCYADTCRTGPGKYTADVVKIFEA